MKYPLPLATFCVALIRLDFHSMMAMAASYVDVFLGEIQTTPLALGHLTKAYDILSRRLSGPEACSDETMAVTITLAIFQRIHQQHSAGLVHFDGLYRMIRQRGGMRKLASENRVLALKPLRYGIHSPDRARPGFSYISLPMYRLDIEFALQYGSPPRFASRDLPGHAFLDKLRTTQSSGPAPEGFQSVEPGLLTIVLDAVNYARVLSISKQESLDYAEAGLLLLNRLVEYAPLWMQRSLDTVHNLLHLTSIALLTTILPEYGHHYDQYDVVKLHLKDELRKYACMDTPSRRLLLWALFVGNISVIPSRERVWELPLLLETCRQLDLRSWVQVRRVLREYAWICPINDKPSKNLWDSLGLSHGPGNSETASTYPIRTRNTSDTPSLDGH